MIFRWLYTLLLSLAAPLLLYGLYKKKEGKPAFGPRWKEHFGYTPALAVTNENTRPIWIHAVSVGESIAAVPVIKALKAQHPEQQIIVTTTTSTGAEQIAKLGDLVEHRYMPIDFSWCVKGFLKTIQPAAMLIMETELWPNTLTTVHNSGIPVIVMNARLSARSADRYRRFKPLFNILTKHIDHLLCLHQDDADRFISLGIPASNVSVTGSIKFDIQISDHVFKKAAELRLDLGEQRPIWVAASTHKGEDEQVLSAFSQVQQSFPDSLLILVPRHPERFNQVEKLCLDSEFNCVRRTQGEVITPDTQIYLADTMGEMLIFQGAADITFMGGSLIGNAVGGHNMLEPAALGKPTITGPSYYNFTDITQQLTAADAVWVCDGSESLAQMLIQLIDNPEQRQKMGTAALTVVKQNQGAVEKTLSALSQQLAR
ncbi:lipid IV(A) 3-deoxy-D-manno-octulosonic acid transferase [uncultured Photobacterium sp.]|uniref:lipid IV(A) 3-deoxy-D-manno-octulosonic acid transferase n=1 Tax=uncultured Photobacterium sp. TaxID=173973 RepID=UPI00262A6676|nr:lipid IV(A) 3-deoxy-D-manno-octulosonic acid transferase [uncultured Photobacterium sp.]